MESYITIETGTELNFWTSKSVKLGSGQVTEVVNLGAFTVTIKERKILTFTVTIKERKILTM